MRKAVLFSVIISLVCSVATPFGVVFASETTPETSSEPAAVPDESSEQPIDNHAEEPVVRAEAPPQKAIDPAPIPNASPQSQEVVSPVTTASSQLRPITISELQLDGVCETASHCTPGSNVEFIEMYNPNNMAVSLQGWKLLRQATGASSEPQVFIEFGDIGIAAHEYALVTLGLQEPNEQIIATYTNSLSNTAGSLLLENPTGERVDIVGWGSSAKSFIGQPASAPQTNQSLQRCLKDGTLFQAEPRNNADELLIYEDLGPTPGIGIECMPPPIINMCSGVVVSEIGANVESQFIELYKSASNQVSVEGCKLQTNRSSVQFNLSGVIAPQSFMVVPIATTSLTLTKTTSGTVYLLSSDSATELQEVDYANLSEHTSWAWFGGNDWRQTYVLTPGANNIFQQHISCEAGYERNVTTGRCNKIVLATGFAPCREGQYRSEETNRCRSIASAAASVLKPCADDQFRNPATNRCKKLASADDLADCGEGRERNPTTNRCRNVLSSDVPAAAFAVEPIKDSATAFVGWWALGGIALLAVGYAGWEWRNEVFQAFRRFKER